MKKLIVIGATALATLFAVLGVAPSAYAYPEGVCNLEVSAQVVNSGESITATCTYSISRDRRPQVGALGHDLGDDLQRRDPHGHR